MYSHLSGVQPEEAPLRPRVEMRNVAMSAMYFVEE